ncbi:biopolymer transporter ExbD [candidate division KSB1 bacterium]|nr:biopolymer transporter ExbD [candidate division KSB1 bacterium]
MNEPISKVDITPLIGVALILVIVFMVTSPMMMTAADMDIELPSAKTIEAGTEAKILISCNREGQLALNDQSITMGELTKALTAQVNKYPNRLVVIQADRMVEHKMILNLLAIAKSAGAQQLAIATLQRNRDKV